MDDDALIFELNSDPEVTKYLHEPLRNRQKAKEVFDVMRFRRYLGDNYRKEDDVLNEQGILEKSPLPIVTIYFLGFRLDNIQNAVVKINRVYQDAITHEIIESSISSVYVGCGKIALAIFGSVISPATLITPVPISVSVWSAN